MKFRVSHLTHYDYDETVAFSPHTLYLRPRESALLRVSRFRVSVTPHAKLTTGRDAFDNPVIWAHFWDRAKAMDIRSEFEIETLETNPFDFIVRPDAVIFPFQYDAYERYVLAPYLAAPAADASDGIQNWMTRYFPRRPAETVVLVSELNRALFASLTHRSREHGGPTPTAITLASGGGACRDLALVGVGVCRSLGLAARYVTGYLFTAANDERADSNAMHAWTEVYLPGAGWKGFDPSHGIFCTDTYIPVAHAPTPECISPVQGSYYSTVHVPSELKVNVLVEQLL